MIAVLVNPIAVIIGSIVGLLLKKGIPEKMSGAVMNALALCVAYIGIDSMLEGNNTIVLIVSMVLGTVCGTLLKIDDGINRLGEFVEKKVKRTDGKISVAEGFMASTLLFCVGAMAIVGSINAGLMNDGEVLLTKSIIDMISACMMASTMGIGVIFSSVCLLVYQGGIALLAGLLQNILTNAAIIAEISCAGGIMILELSLNMLGIIKIKIADQLPSIIFVPIVYMLVQYLPI